MILLADESLLVKIFDEIKIMRSDMAELKSDAAELKSDVAELKSDVAGLKSDVSQLKFDVSELKIRQQEDHQILKALEHKADVNKAEHDKMLIDISKIQGYQKDISESIDAMKEIIGRHEVDIAVLKRRSV